MIVREARPGELEAVLALLREDVIRERPEPPEVTARQRAAFAELLADPHHLLMVGELEAGLVATAQVSWLRYLMYDGGLVCHLESVRVAPSHRGNGLGQRLVSTIIELARDRGCARLQLSTNAARADARRFYRRLGFAESHIGMKLFLEDA